jgi:hypothetical protein
VEVPPRAASGPPTNGFEADIHGATPDQIIATIARLTARHPERGVNLDLLINALKAEGFGRPPGSPRLVTRLRKMKDVEVMPTGMVRLVNLPPGPLPFAAPEPPAERNRVSAEGAEKPERSSSARRPRRRGGRGRRSKRSDASATLPTGAAAGEP